MLAAYEETVGAAAVARPRGDRGSPELRPDVHRLLSALLPRDPRRGADAATPGAALRPDQGLRPPRRGCSATAAWRRSATGCPPRAARISELFDDYDVLITPATAQLPVEIGHWRGKGALRTINGMTQRLSLRGDLELHRAAGGDDSRPGSPTAGLPRSVMLVARPNDEATLVSVAAQLEAERPWAGPAGPDARGAPPGCDAASRATSARSADLELLGLGRHLHGAVRAAELRPALPRRSSWKRSRKSSEWSGSWWNSSSRCASTRRAKVRVSLSREWPQPTCSGYSSSVYWQSWISRSASAGEVVAGDPLGLEALERRAQRRARGRRCR